MAEPEDSNQNRINDSGNSLIAAEELIEAYPGSLVVLPGHVDELGLDTADLPLTRITTAVSQLGATMFGLIDLNRLADLSELGQAQLRDAVLHESVQYRSRFDGQMNASLTNEELWLREAQEKLDDLEHLIKTANAEVNALYKLDPAIQADFSRWRPLVDAILKKGRGKVSFRDFEKARHYR